MTTRRIRLLLVPACLSLLWTTACSPESRTTSMNSYKETKTMVLDILKTKEGQKAIQEASGQGGQGGQEGQGGKGGQEGQGSQGGQAGKGGQGGGKMQMLSPLQAETLKTTVKDVLTDPNYSKVLSDTMKDPKFAGDFARAISKENKQLHKDLLKDPEYQNQVFQLMKDPEYEKIMIEIMKGTAYRKQAMDIFRESLDSPLFREELIKLMQKAIEEHTKPKKQGKEKGGKEGGGKLGKSDGSNK